MHADPIAARQASPAKRGGDSPSAIRDFAERPFLLRPTGLFVHEADGVSPAAQGQVEEVAEKHRGIVAFRRVAGSGHRSGGTGPNRSGGGGCTGERPSRRTRSL